MDGNDKPPTAERTRKAGWQVGRDKEAVWRPAPSNGGGGPSKRRLSLPRQPVPFQSAEAACSRLGIKLVEPEPPEGQYQFRLAGGPKIWAKDEPKPE